MLNLYNVNSYFFLSTNWNTSISIDMGFVDKFSCIPQIKSYTLNAPLPLNLDWKQDDYFYNLMWINYFLGLFFTSSFLVRSLKKKNKRKRGSKFSEYNYSSLCYKQHVSPLNLSLSKKSSLYNIIQLHQLRAFGSIVFIQFCIQNIKYFFSLPKYQYKKVNKYKSSLTYFFKLNIDRKNMLLRCINIDYFKVYNYSINLDTYTHKIGYLGSLYPLPLEKPLKK